MVVTVDQWTVANRLLQVLHQTLRVENGRVSLGTRMKPASIQIFSHQRTSMTATRQPAVQHHLSLTQLTTNSSVHPTSLAAGTDELQTDTSCVQVTDSKYINLSPCWLVSKNTVKLTPSITHSHGNARVLYGRRCKSLEKPKI